MTDAQQSDAHAQFAPEPATTAPGAPVAEAPTIPRPDRKSVV